jgi:flavin-dependent thymidylate synthase
MAVKFVDMSVIPQGLAPSEQRNALKLIEICGRTAYKSEDKITEDSAKSFVLMLKRHGHLSVLEHSNAVLKIEPGTGGSTQLEKSSARELAQRLTILLAERNGYHRIRLLSGAEPQGVAVSGNFRSWIETIRFLQEQDKEWAAFLNQSLSRFFPGLFTDEDSSIPFPSIRVSLMSEDEQMEALQGDPGSDLPVFVFKVVCDRGITHELVRHRVFSFTQESTRYVNYGNKGMVLIIPEELQAFASEDGTLTGNSQETRLWLQRAETLFKWYQEDLGRGLRPEIARDILPNLLKSEIFISGRWSGWKHFIHLRASKQAHPRIRSIAKQVESYFRTMGLSAVQDGES